MSKFLLFVLLSFGFVAVDAQTEKGDWLVGGRVDLNTGENNTQIGFSPSAGLFLIDKFAVGGDLSINYVKFGDNKVTSFGIGPFARYYFTKADARPLLHGSFKYLSSKTKSPAGSSTNNGINFLIAAGVAVFINENVSIEPLAGYSYAKFKDVDGSGGFNLGVGFQVYLSKRQIEKISN